MTTSRTPSLSGAAGPASNATPARSRPTLEIVPEDRFLVFHGDEHQASALKLRGIVRLAAHDSMTILRPKIRLEGKRKISWIQMSAMGASEMVDKRVFWSQEHRLGEVETAHKISAGFIEWPFEFEIAPDMPESVEGLRETYIIYTLHASVSRPGWNTRDVVAQQRIRIVRTLGPDAMGVTRSRTNSDIWANKVAYSISIPSDAVVYGTSVTADIQLSPIKKGLTFGKIELRMVESVIKRIQASEVPDARGDRSRTDDLEVARMSMDFPEDSKVAYPEETADDPVLADEMYKFKARLPLPKSLNLIRQDVDHHSINITHRLKLTVNLINPEGHVSQLVCRLPVKLFISPNLPIDESNRVQSLPEGMMDESALSAEALLAAPPQYGQHQLDMLYDNVDTTGYFSQVASGAATPAGLQSRRGSDDATSFAALASSSIPHSSSLLSSSAPHGAASPSMLHSRLTALQEGISSNFGSPAGPSRNASNISVTRDNETNTASSHANPGPSAGVSPHPSAPTSAPMSRRVSDEGMDHGSDYNLDNLSRVPSYGAALRTSGAVTPYNEGPPSYTDATSRPPSPGSATSPGQYSASASVSPSVIQRPPNAYIQDGAAGSSAAAAAAMDGAHDTADQHSSLRLRLLRAQS